MTEEEEKQAIEILKQEPDYSLSYYKREKAIDIVLNLIDKQQKEIEELKKDNEEQWRHRCKMAIELDFNVVSKDKIREIISKYVDIEEQFNYGSIELFGEELTNMIKELLEE